MKNAYVVITPVKDEEAYIEKTLLSMIAQTVHPVRWVIVDDGSSDQTVPLIRKHARDHEWMTLVENGKLGRRNTGKAEVLAFNAGLEHIRNRSYRYIVKLDGDVFLPEDYFEKLLHEFHVDPELGIASGIYLEDHGKGWQPVGMPSYHAAGASKVLRRECFEQIGGFLATPGWDTVDEIKAMYLGWRTCHFPEIRFLHLKNEGSGMGFLKTSRMHGEIFYLTGGSPLFFLVKFLKRLLGGRPPILAALTMMQGYLGQMVRRQPLLVHEGEAAYYNQLLSERFFSSFRLPFGKGNS